MVGPSKTSRRNVKCISIEYMTEKMSGCSLTIPFVIPQLHNDVLRFHTEGALKTEKYLHFLVALLFVHSPE